MKTYYVLIRNNCQADPEVQYEPGQYKKAEANTFHIGSDNGLNLNLDSINCSYMQTLQRLSHEAGMIQSYFTYLYTFHLN